MSSSSSNDEDGISEAPDAVINFLGNCRTDGLRDDDSDMNDIKVLDEFHSRIEAARSYHVEQYAQGVLDFSSQYGSNYSISYTAPNITGRPTKYPEYGDFPETYAMRTYGDWWQCAPSRVREIQSQNLPKIPIHDFIVIYFEDYIIPDEIAIFETFNAGAIVRIWAYTITKCWFCLWEAPGDFLKRPLNNSTNENKARRFAPTLHKLKLPTKTIRLEFNHSRLNYFTQIDAVLLCGFVVTMTNIQNILEFYERRRKGSIMHKLQSMQFRLDFKQNYQNSLQNFFMHDLNKFIDILSTVDGAEGCPAEAPKQEQDKIQIGLKDMPFEIMLNIFSYLDLISLFHVGKVSRFCYDVSTHPLLYSELNLKPYWHLTTNDLLCTLAKRATVLKKFDLSWCGLYNTISSTEFKKFIQQRGDSLTHLRLNSCKFLNASCIETVGIVCDNLRELTLRNCSIDPPILNFSCLANLKNLERLDLFQTAIEPELLYTMLENNPKLKHLNLAFCGVAVNMDTVAQYIATYNRQLISLDMWKSHFLTASGLQDLANCPDLEELDFGWCLREVTLGDSFRELLTNCTKLKKLFLATVRGLTDLDVSNIANLCSNLEQLDLMGVLGISKERYHEVLVNCKHLQLLDLSFCDNIDDSEISLWARTFKVHIKCSHVPLNY